jgi:hypothetical protein
MIKAPNTEYVYTGTDSSIRAAILNLQSDRFRPVLGVFGKVIRQRIKYSDPRCALLGVLSQAGWPADPLIEDCSAYIAELGLQDAQRKCNADVLGNSRRPNWEFNGAFGDFWAEMSAIKILANEGFTAFQPLYTRQEDGTTSDYAAQHQQTPAYIEVKNIRSNKTVTDVFDGSIGLLHRSYPSQYAFRLQVDYSYDEPPTAEQERRIVGFVTSLRGRTPEFVECLDLIEGTASITVMAGDGSAFMCRGMGPDSPEPLNKERFIKRVRQKSEEALAQMRSDTRMKVLVINYDAPSAMISEDFVIDGKTEMIEVFNGDVKPYLLFYRSLVFAEPSR